MYFSRRTACCNINVSLQKKNLFVIFNYYCRQLAQKLGLAQKVYCFAVFWKKTCQPGTKAVCNISKQIVGNRQELHYL